MSALLPVRPVEKPWGMDRLPAPFAAPDGKRIGEIWFEPCARLDDLLVKYIFASEKLSVQVHPTDAQTLAAGAGRQGKEECWLVIDAQPGAAIGIGFNAPIDGPAMRAAALDGSIERLLTWSPVKPGDFFYIPANTVHAIGGGVSLIEVQQNSDVTYRLYDYGRPRPLHLDQGIAVACGEPHDAKLRRRVPEGQTISLVDGPLFRLGQVCGRDGAGPLAGFRDRPLLVIPRIGIAHVDGETVVPGDCAVAASPATVRLDGGATCLIAQPC